MKNYFISLYFITILLCPFILPANPEENTQEIVVTGYSVPVSSTKAGVGITTISSKDIESMKPNTFDEIIRTVPGLVIRQNGAGKLTTLSIRGGNSGSSMIMVDGMPINDIAGINNDIDISSIPVDNIERIEIIKGPVGASLGSYAMNGAINIITKKGGKKPVQAAIDMQSSLASLYFRGNAAVYGSKGIADYRISGGYLYDEGVSSASSKYQGNYEKDSDAMGNFNAYLNLKPVENLSTAFYFNYVDRNSDLDNGGGPNNDNTDYLQRTKRFHSSWRTKYLLNDLWEPSINLGYVYNSRLYGSAQTLSNNTNDIFDGHSFNLDFQNNFYIVDEFTLSAGLTYDYNEIYSRTGSVSSSVGENRFSGYLQGTITLFDSWTTVLAIRGQKEGTQEFIPVYRASTVYDIELIDLQLKFSIGTGAMAPSLYQLYDPVFGNSTLKQQESFSYEFGFTNGLFDKKIVYGLSWFDNYYNKMISYGSYIENNTIKTGFYNETNTHTRGIEAELGIYPVKWLDITAAYTWMQTFTTSGLPLSRRPEHQFTGKVTVRPVKNLNIYAEVIYSGKSVATAFDNADFNDEYYLLNMAVSYDLKENLQIFLKGTNITNTEYEEIYGYGTKGIEVFAGMKLKI